MRFFDSYGRAPSSEDELSQFIAQEEREAARRRERAAEAEELMNALYQSNAELYNQWLKSLYLKMTKALEHQKPDRAAALLKLASTELFLEALDEAGGLSISLPFSEPDLTGEAKAAFSALCQGFEGNDMIGELQVALDWKAEFFPFALPSAEYIDEEIPCLGFIAKVYGVIALSVSKKSSFEKSILLYRVKGVKQDGRSFSFNYPPPYFLGYHWHIVDLGWSSESLIVPIVLLDGLSKGQIEVEGAKVEARRGACTFYSIEAWDETIAINDRFAGFLQRLKQPWYQDMARLGVLDTKTSEIVQLKLTQSTSPSTTSRQGWKDDDFIACLTSPALGFRTVAANEKLKILKGKNIDLFIE